VCGSGKKRHLLWRIGIDFCPFHDLRLQLASVSSHPKRPPAGLSLIRHHPTDADRPIEMLDGEGAASRQ